MATWTGRNKRDEHHKRTDSTLTGNIKIPPLTAQPSIHERSHNNQWDRICQRDSTKLQSTPLISIIGNNMNKCPKATLYRNSSEVDLMEPETELPLLCVTYPKIISHTCRAWANQTAMDPALMAGPLPGPEPELTFRDRILRRTAYCVTATTHAGITQAKHDY